MRSKMIVCGALAASMVFGLGACAQKKDEASQAATESAQAASGAATEAATEAASKFKTLGDVYAASPEGMSSTYGDGSFSCGFKLNDQWYHVAAKLTDEQEKKLDEVWAVEQDKAEKVLADIPVGTCEVLAAPTADELAAYAGKKGADLSKEGFSFVSPTVNGEQTDCTGTKGDFEYLVTFKGKVADEATEDVAGAVADLPVESVVIQGVSWSVLDSK